MNNEEILQDCIKWYHKNNGDVNTRECFQYAIEKAKEEILNEIKNYLKTDVFLMNMPRTQYRLTEFIKSLSQSKATMLDDGLPRAHKVANSNSTGVSSTLPNGSGLTSDYSRDAPTRKNVEENYKSNSTLEQHPDTPHLLKSTNNSEISMLQTPSKNIDGQILSAKRENISLCPNCNCMTKNIGGQFKRCGKCGEWK